VNKDWLDIAILEDYLEGKLDSKTMNRVEREALEDPFVAEALAGLSAAPKRSFQSISLLQKQLQERVAQQQHTKKTTVITWQRLSIAATAAVLFISVGIIFWMKQNNYQHMLAGKSKKVDVNIAPKELADRIAGSDQQISAAPATATGAAGNVIDSAFNAAKANALASTARPNGKGTAQTDHNPAADAPGAELREVEIATVVPLRQQTTTLSSSAIATAVQTALIRGKVTDSASGEPLANVNIFIDKRPKGQTNEQGEFEINADSVTAASQILAASVSYKNAIMPLKLNEANNLILSESKNQVNDVVIRGYQKRSKEEPAANSFAASGKEARNVPVGNVEQVLQGRVSGLNIQKSEPYPSVGWRAFKVYLIRENRFSAGVKAGQSAEFQFTLKNGKPADVKVIRGLSKLYDAEAIRLIRNWPKWHGFSGAKPVTVILDY